MTAPVQPTHVAATTNEQGQIVTTPQTGAPIQSATSKASADALARIQQTGTAALPETAQPRASDGTFGTPLPEATPAQPPAAPAPEAGREGETPVAAPETPAQTPEEIAAQEALQARVVPIEVNGETLDLDVGDPAIAEIVRGSIETAREVEAIRAEAEREIADAVAVRDLAEIDPVGFAQRMLANSPAGREHLVLSLLTEEGMFEGLRDRLKAMLADPRDLAVERAQQREARITYEREAREARAENTKVRQNVHEIRSACATIARMLPNAAMQETAYNDMIQDVRAYAEHHDMLTVPAEHIPVVLARRLTALGVDPVVAAQAVATAVQPKSGKNGATRGRATAAALPAPPRPASAPAAPVRSAPTGPAFVASAQQRRTVAAIPAAGAGSPSVGPDLVPPKNPDGSPMGIAASTAWHREQLAKNKTGLATAAR